MKVHQHEEICTPFPQAVSALLMDEPSLPGCQTTTKLIKNFNIEFLFFTFTILNNSHLVCSHQFWQWRLLLCFQLSNNPFAFLFIAISTNKIKLRECPSLCCKKDVKGENSFLEKLLMCSKSISLFLFSHLNFWLSKSYNLRPNYIFIFAFISEWHFKWVYLQMWNLQNLWNQKRNWNKVKTRSHRKNRSLES